MQDERKFTITGVVAAPKGKGTNPFVTAGGFSRLNVETSVGGKKSFAGIIGFSEVIEAMRKLGPGMTVTVTGDVSSAKLTDKARADVVVDGYPVWVTELVARAIVVRGGAVEAAPEVDGMPAGW
jgi:hypothetical protein